MKHYLYVLSALVFLLHPELSIAVSQRENLVEIGKGQAYYLKFIKVYDATLYGEQQAEIPTILDDHISKCLHLEYAVDISREDFIRAADTVLERQFSGSLSDKVKEHVEMLHRGYLDVAEGDNYSLCYDGGSAETTLFHNNQRLVSIKDTDFAKVYFGIWLGGYKPLDKNLRDDLLSGLALRDN